MLNTITEDQAVKWFAKSIVNYIIRYPNGSFPIVIAKSIDTDYHNGYYCIASYSFVDLLKKDKYRAAYHKFELDFHFQERVIEAVRVYSDIDIIDKVEDFSFVRPVDYQKTYYIKLNRK